MSGHSNYGLKIRNYQAAVLYEYNLGVRNLLSYTDAMLTNSLFLDFLYEKGISVEKNNFTRDVICLQFDFGTVSYEDQKQRLTASLEGQKQLDPSEERDRKIESLLDALKRAKANESLYVPLSKQELRTKIYEEGIKITYPDKKVVTYIPTYRSAGKAKMGQVMCVRKELYEESLRFLRMGIKLPEHNAPLVEIQAYASLIASSICGKVKITPEQILVIKDVERSVETNVLSVETDEDNHCIVRNIEDYSLTNVLFDGQALIDKSIFPSCANDFILLRQHFTKCAAFSTNIQLFMKDTFKEKYDTAYVEDMFGRQVKVSDIKLICTDTSLKWLKFDVTFDDWAKWIRRNGCDWGIVKTAHPSKVGHGLQRASYQICNSLDINTIDHVAERSKDYIMLLKTDDDFFFDYLERNQSFANDYDVLIALAKQDPEFIQSSYFRERRKVIVASQLKKIKSGKLLMDAENLVIVGSPYAMLLASIGRNPDDDNTFGVEKNAIQCYTTRFNDGEYLAFMRSPFNGFFNLTHLHNVYHEKMERYFNFGKLVVAVNLIGTEFQARNNGSD